MPDHCTVYVETTIPNAYYSIRTGPKMVARREWTQEWWDEHRQAYRVVSSRATLEEVSRGVHPHQRKKVALVRELPFVPVESDIEQIVAEYIQHKLMPTIRRTMRFTLP